MYSKKRQKHPYKYFFSSKEGVRLLSTLILLRHTYIYIFTLSILKIMCKFAKLTKTHRKVNPALIPFSYSNQLQKKQPNLILNYMSTVSERPTEISFLILNKVSVYFDYLRLWPQAGNDRETRPLYFIIEIFLKPW